MGPSEIIELEAYAINNGLHSVSQVLTPDLLHELSLLEGKVVIDDFCSIDDDD